MNTTLGMYIAMDAIGSLILLMMYTNFGSQKNKQSSFDNKLFDVIIFLNLALLLTDMLGWMLTGHTFFGARLLNIVTTAIYYVLQPVLGLMWLIYCEYKLTEDKKKTFKRLPYYIIPTAIMLVLSVATCFTPIFFWIGHDNKYYRAPFFLVAFVLCLIYCVCATVIILAAMKKDTSKSQLDRNFFLLIYPVFPIVAAILQSIFYGINILWMGSVISLLIIFFNLQNVQITTDALTGLNNRRRFEHYMDFKNKNPQKQPFLFILMLDIDNFKTINDKHGHGKGDEVLRQFAKILLQSALRSDFVARIGGDEFVVIGERDHPDQITELTQTIHNQASAYNRQNTSGYTLGTSIGCAILRQGENMGLDQLLLEADNKMYEEKQQKKKTKGT